MRILETGFRDSRLRSLNAQVTLEILPGETRMLPPTSVCPTTLPRLDPVSGPYAALRHVRGDHTG